MFVKRLVDKATSKKPGGSSDSLKPEDLDPRLVFHYGIPSSSMLLAYDSVQEILAISTKDGGIKLLGKDNSQVLLESDDAAPSKFLQFLENQGILLNVTLKNNIEASHSCKLIAFIWDISKKTLSHVHIFKEEITSCSILQLGFYMYVGDSGGNVSVLKLNQGQLDLVKMSYRIPVSASHGNTTEVAGDASIVQILPQPTAESKRVLIVFRDGLITLWAIRESKPVFTTGESSFQLPSQSHETKKVTSACWGCPIGTKVVIGYSNGEILIWPVLPAPNVSAELTIEKEPCSVQNAPICKLNLGYKVDKVPIALLKWAYVDGKASRLYVMGASDFTSVNLLQVIILNEQTESRTIKLGLHLPERCLDMEIVSISNVQNKHKQDLLLVGKSGHIYVYDDHGIEKYLSQSKSSTSLPKEVVIKLPFLDSCITSAKLTTGNSHLSSLADEDYIILAKSVPPLLPAEIKSRDGTHLSSMHFSGFSTIRNLYITGHSDGAINFWDASSPCLLPIFSLKQQSEDNFSLSGIPVTALYSDIYSRLLISGDQDGAVRIFKFKPEPFASDIAFLSLQGGSKRRSSHIIQSVQVIKVNGAVLCINLNRSSRHLAVGTDQGYVSVIDSAGPTVLFQKHITSELSTAVVSVEFETCTLHGFERNVLIVATKDSSILAVGSDTGDTLTTSMVHPKKRSRALFMLILDGQSSSSKVPSMSDEPDLSKGNSKQLLLLCSEKAAYVYSLMQVIQGVKKVHYKKKFQSSSCCWASAFSSPTGLGLVLIFTNGRIEIRSLPELTLLKETSVRGFTFSASKLNSTSECSISSSQNGDLLIVNGDQEIFFVTVLHQKETFRLSDSFVDIYKKGLVAPQEGVNAGPMIPKEKKKGLFNSVIKEFKGNKATHEPVPQTEDSRESIEELLTIFSTANFPDDVENRDGLDLDEDDIDLNIDDIDLEDTTEKPKGHNMIPNINKEKLTRQFQALKGKFKQITVKTEKSSTIKEELQDEKAGTVDQIKRKYGFPSSGETSAAKIAQSKLAENVRKLQGISLRTAEMQDTAKSFSSLAKEMLRTAEQDKQNS
ncbi:Lethal giant larvae (Lgl)-like, C-terminal domain [Dillenia turbinata]|uniref:Lethal giant larvae (Lgl)-like, C-terminal domain n=1 Tax=Dillenia turbinata TaxID=194707 RepID=A0AAN8Z125_9MAGN